MTCHVVLSLIDDLVDNELSPPDEAQVKVHLAACSACQAEYDRALRLKRMLAAAPATDPGPDYWAEVSPLIAAKTVDREPVVERTSITHLPRRINPELSRALLTCAASLLLLFAAVWVGSQRREQVTAANASPHPLLVTAPLRGLLASDQSTIMSVHERRLVARASLVLGAPGPLGRFATLPELLWPQ
ncbi:MAG: zf-HC2 domain-containing protein [Candidatus Zixiibacteriota bacterium]